MKWNNKGQIRSKNERIIYEGIKKKSNGMLYYLMPINFVEE